MQTAPANALIRGIAAGPRAVLLVALALAAAAVLQLVDLRSGGLRLDVDPSLDPLLAQDFPDRIHHEQARRRFGSEETVLVVLRTGEPGGVYQLEVLRRLQALTRDLRRVPGVAAAQSLTSTPLPVLTGEGIDLRRVQDEELQDPTTPQALRARAEGQPLVRGQLVSTDGSAAAIAVTLQALGDRELQQLRVAETIQQLADREAGPGVQVHVTGAAIIRAATSAAVLDQLGWVVPAVAVLLGGLLALTFRSWRGVLLPLLVILLALTVTLATLSALGRSLNLITSLVPPLLVTMGLAYCAHVLTEFESLLRAAPETPQPERSRRLLMEISGPVLLTGFTTAAGLLALMLTDLPAIREFAWLSALGTLYIVVLVLTVLPAALHFVPARAPRTALPGQRLFDAASQRAGEFDTRHRRGILAAAALVFLAASLLASRIEVGDRFAGVFPPESRARADFEAVNAVMGGVNPLGILLDGRSADAFTDPQRLRAVDELETWLRAQPEVGAVSGLPDHVRSLNATLGGAVRPEIPESRELIKQLLFFGDSESLSAVVSADHSSSLIRLRLTVDDTPAISALLERLRVRLRELPPGIEAHITGQSALLAHSVESVTSSQLESIALALLLVFLCLSLQFASASIGLLATLPTLLQTAVYFGALGLFGIPLNATTSLVECLVLGLAVDDTIHYLARFNSAAKRGGSEAKAAVSALTTVLRPVTLTKAILALGFLMLVTGELRNQVLFGYLAAFTLFAAWLVDVFVTPAFMSGVRVVTLWDSLRLNLGADVQSSIPLFAGLSTRQARIFALMANMQTLPAGARVMSEGDPAGDIYVVIEGRLSVWTERDGTRREISQLGRGAVLGEAGYFGQRRTASVEALTPVRLLRFDDADQERVIRRYPGIAARVFLNLNRLQAERRAVPRTPKK